MNQELAIKVLAGSRAYGLQLPTSDYDYRGIFILPNQTLLSGIDYTPQISHSENDEVYYELNRFVHLAMKNNPNIMEILFSPEENWIEYDERLDPLFLNNEVFILEWSVKPTDADRLGGI